MDKNPLFVNNYGRNSKNMDKSKEYIVNKLFDEKEDFPIVQNNLHLGNQNNQPLYFPDDLFKGSNQVPKNHLISKTSDDAYRISKRCRCMSLSQ